LRKFLLILPLVLGTGAVIAAEPAVQTAVTKDGLRFGWLGSKPTNPLPTVLFIGGAVEDSLVGPEYTEAITTLGPRFLFATLDIPGFGEDRREGEPGGIQTWRYRLDHNEDFIGDFVRRASAVLDHLIAEGFTDPARVAAFGTSRGGFLSLHFSAADQRVSHVAGYAPVTDLFVLTEFAKMTNEQPARLICASRIADRLTERKIWLIIGSTDFRVSTERTMDFTGRVIESALAQGRTPAIELHVQTSEGHRVPPFSYESGARWLLRQWASGLK